MVVRDRRVALTIIATDKHCNNCCLGMSNNAKYCNYFWSELEWDKRKKHNGNKRLDVCIQAEVWRKV